MFFSAITLRRLHLPRMHTSYFTVQHSGILDIKLNLFCQCLVSRRIVQFTQFDLSSFTRSTPFVKSNRNIILNYN